MLYIERRQTLYSFTITGFPRAITSRRVEMEAYVLRYILSVKNIPPNRASIGNRNYNTFMADVTFYNVQHGEYISIAMNEENGEELIVIRDFGAYSAFLNNFLNDEAKRMVNDGKKRDAVLSHAHGDHYKGFVSMHNYLTKHTGKINNKPFRRAYIPYLRYKDANDLGAKILKVGLYYIFLVRSRSNISIQIKDWIKMTPIMYDLSDHLVGVKQGDVIPDWSQKGMVYWPPKPSSTYYKDIAIDLEEIASLLQQDIDQTAKEQIDATHKELCEALELLITGTSGLSLGTTALDYINSILAPFLEICTTTNKRLSSTQQKAYKKYNDNIDNHSVVFSIDAVDGSDGILFLSDLDGDTMNIMSKYFKHNKHYKLIKSAHHGTRLGSTFAKRVKADTIINCCGIGNKRYFGPIKDYFNLANTVICSDWVYNAPTWKDRQLYCIFNSDNSTIKV